MLVMVLIAESHFEKYAPALRQGIHIIYPFKKNYRVRVTFWCF